jgi:hypothetical protein
MSERSGATAPAAAPPTHPSRRPVASFTTYEGAEHAVDYLSDQGFPVQQTAIVGHDLQWVEEVTGRLTYLGAALHAAGAGALTGLLIGWIFGLLSWISPLIAGGLLALYGLVFGAIVGAILGLLFHALQGGRRDFSSVQMTRPSRFELLVDSEVADRAARLLGQERASGESPSATTPDQ